MTEKKQNPADLAGAYALNALSAEEKAEFERYLAESAEARTEAAELREAALALGLAADPVQPSAGLKASLMAQIAATPQLPQVPVPVPAAEAAAEAPPASAEPAAPPAQAAPAEARARRRWFQGPAGMLLAAAAAVVLFVGGAFVGQALNANQFEQQQAASLAEINAAPDAQRALATTSDGHTATLVWSGELGLSALLIDDLPELPAGKDYQLWYMNDTGAFSAGTFDSTGTGTVWRVLEGTMHAGDQVGLTVEPDGGSPEPTSAPIVAIQS